MHTLGSPTPGGEAFSQALVSYLTDTRALVTPSSTFALSFGQEESDSSGANAIAAQAYRAAVRESLASPCLLLRVSTTESFVLHAYMATPLETWSYSTVLEACVLRHLLQAFPRFAAVGKVTANIVLENVSLASSASAAVTAVYDSKSPLMAEFLRQVCSRAEVYPRESESKATAVLALWLGLYPHQTILPSAKHDFDLLSDWTMRQWCEKLNVFCDDWAKCE
jgi:hypothetical protein